MVFYVFQIILFFVLFLIIHFSIAFHLTFSCLECGCSYSLP